LTARWIFPVDQPPLERGSITISGQRIVAVEPYGSRTPDIDLGDAAILPGLVNAHTHLDLTGLRGRITPSEDFTMWLRGVIRHRQSQSGAEIAQDVEHGLKECTASGTTLLGDISSQGLSWPALENALLHSVVFYELLGLPKTRAQQTWAGVCDWLRKHPETDICRPALSPHAPYSVRSSLFRAAANLSHGRGFPLAIHLAETQAEIDLLRSHEGPFVKFLSEMGVWDPAGVVKGTQEVLELCRRADRVLLVHCNYLADTGAIPANSTVVYCPRTHQAFGHDPYPLRKFLQAGVRVALGTDSLASNPDLSILAELRFVHERYPDVPGEALLRMATLSGAEALGWETETGSLLPGKSADLVVILLQDENESDPHRLVLRSRLPPAATMFRGRWAYVSKDWRSREGLRLESCE
jgi:cytosine/adenosine deaminase-related metal-dependent hydrolase